MILLTGATGRLGQAVVTALQAAELPFKALVRDPDWAAELWADAAVPLVAGDLTERDSLLAALEGIEQLILILPADADTLVMGSIALEAARQKGVKRVVYVSLGTGYLTPEGRVNLPVADMHYQVERQIEHGGRGAPVYTILRPAMLMQRMADLIGASIDRNGRFILPLGQARFNLIDAVDVAEVIVAVLKNDRHKNKVYALTGPEQFDGEQLARKTAEILGRGVTYRPMSPLLFRFVLWVRGEAPFVREHAAGQFAEMRRQGTEPATEDVAQILERPPRSWGTFVRANLNKFQQTSGGT